MADPVTMKDIASALGVSTATISRALRGDPGISPARTAAVLEAARRLQYRPSAAARTLRTKSSDLIGVVVQTVGDSYVGEVVRGIQTRARDFGVRPLFFMSEGREDLEGEALQASLSEHVRNFIAVSPIGAPHLFRRAAEEGLQVSVINWDVAVGERLFEKLQSEAPDGTLEARIARATPGTDRNPICHIKFDDVDAAMLATNHLLELGHRQFIHLRGPNIRSSLLRLLGFRRALEAAGLWPQPVLAAGPFGSQNRGLVISTLLGRARPPLAIVAYDDLAAVEVLRAADKAGLRVPDDVSVIGINDIPFCAYTNPPLTSVAQPKQQLGALAVEVLLNSDAHGARVRPLPGSLVVRESTGRPGLLGTRSRRDTDKVGGNKPP